MSPDLAAMVAPFAEEEVQSYDKNWTDKQGRARSMTFSYIEDETVMDRLDLGFGRGNWAIHVDPIPVYEGVVKVTLSVRVDDSPWVEYQDFGYPNREGGESLKEAVSDGIRRCGRYLGIARDLYRKDTAPVRITNGQRTHTGHRDGNPGAASDRSAPARSSTDLPEGPALDWDVLSDKKPASFAAAQAAKVEPDGEMTYPQLADRAKALSVPLKVLGDTSKRLYGPDAWKLTDLTNVQRYAVAVEVGLL